MAKKSKTQLQSELDALGVEYPPNAKNAELERLLAESKGAEDDSDNLGLESDGDDDDDPEIAGLDDDDDIDPTVGGLSDGADDSGDDGLSDADVKAYREAHRQQRQATAVVLPKDVELTPAGKKPIYVAENLSLKFSGRRVFLKAGEPLPRGVIPRARVAELLEAKKLSVSKPRAKQTKRRSLLS